MIDEELERAIGQLEELWVFGYGSILWKQGFSYSDQLVGYVDGYVRRFWQGNTTHRGTPRAPGRVATLIEDPQGRVWGVAYQLRGSNQIRQALDHLGIRECSLGGYACETLVFTERMSPSNQIQRTIPVLTFIAVPSNALYLGPTSLDDLASQIIACRGGSGTNVEYVLRMADYIHDNIPEDTDEHLFMLVQKIKERMDCETQKLLESQTSSDDSNSLYLLESQIPLNNSNSAYVLESQTTLDDSNSTYLLQSQATMDDSNSAYLLESQKVLSLMTNKQDNDAENLKHEMLEQLLLAFTSLNNFRNLNDCNFQANRQTDNFALSA